jgi:hypothetical protein
MKRLMFMPILGLIGGISASAHAASADAPGTTPVPVASSGVSKEIKILGKKFGITFSTAENLTKDGITATLNSTILGKQKSLIKANLQAGDDKGKLQLFVNGVQVTSVENPLGKDGTWEYELKIPPVNVGATLISYGIGPIVLKVNGGYSLGGGLNTSLATGLVSETEAAANELLKAKLEADIQAAGYVEGSANLAIVRGGLRGEVEAADGTVTAQAALVVGEDPLSWGVNGELSLFSGAISAFADRWSLFSGWKHIWTGNLFKWKGICFTFDNNFETNGKCVAH